jgi:hypothetical protein
MALKPADSLPMTHGLASLQPITVASSCKPAAVFTLAILEQLSAPSALASGKKKLYRDVLNNQVGQLQTNTHWQHAQPMGVGHPSGGIHETYFTVQLAAS